MFSLVNVAHAAGDGISVKLNPYILGYIGGLPVTATMLTAWLTMIILIALAYYVGRNPQLVPTKLQSIFELIVGGVYDYVKDVLGDAATAKRYFPVIMTIFIFILGINWVGLLPGVTSVGFYGADGAFTPLLYPSATDLNITIAFAIIAFVTVEVAGVLGIGLWKYTGKFINFKSPLAFVIGLIELISELARLVSFSFRLFGNIFAGKTLLVVATFFVPYFIPIPIFAYELFVGVIQATVFAILTLFFIKLALEEPH